MSELKPTCCADVPYGNWGQTSKCSFKAKANEGGQWYCMIHAPSKVAEKYAARDAAFEIEKNARHAARAAQKELERRAACFDDLLEALEEVKRVFDANPTSIVDTVWAISHPATTLYDHCHANIIKAIGAKS